MIHIIKAICDSALIWTPVEMDILVCKPIEKHKKGSLL